MKIAIITETFLPSTDGVVTRLSASIRWLKKQGHEILVIAPDLGVSDFEGVKVAGVPAYTFFLYKDKKLSFFSKKVKAYLKDFQPDLVHAVNPAFLGATGIYYTKKLKLPLMASYHTHVPKYADYYHFSFLKPAMWKYFKKLHDQASLNLCTSKAVLKELEDKNFHNLHHWKRGVDTKQFHPSFFSQDMRNRLSNGQPEQTLLLFVGRLAPEKEVEKIKSVLEKSNDYCLAIVGDGPHRNFLEKHFKGTNTIFTGFLHGDDLASAYASSDLFVFPSTTETLGLVLMEAMAAGLPVISADSGPTGEQIEDGVNGLLYHSTHPDGLFNTVEKLKNKEERVKMGVRAHEGIQSVGWDDQSSQLYDYYMQTLELHHKAVK
ncbi:glycosyltransferase family 1 protein [Jeotgalibacillus sp. R-1-5s-1]|uniref:glycosyltransferase family 4 protein n=1 Tax=Jeotgalibacillus sp. R-1-5s-1 TaxID=2555897 RepID=UPI00106C6509|nr:glycosyltransferase family 1 protein [Jeotgalibacillus sp. R-1-5s-1]TFD99977.1 glycosyltransferase family 1 protein [Jeotgalibacillus sp. R-1-5s-1]